MELKGKLLDIMRDVRTGAYRLVLEVMEIPPGVDKLPEELRINLSRWTNKRSLSANAYYWVLVSKLSKAMRRSESWIHNWLLCDYGVPFVVDGKIPYVPIKESSAAQIEVMESSDYHLKPTGYVFMDHDGDICRDYMMLKGSHLFDSEEMSHLIDGAVEEAKAIGIETLPPAEIERMMKDYEEHHARG